MSISKTTEHVNQMVADIEEATDCERIKTFIDKHVKTVTDTITEQAGEMSELLSKYGPLMKLPSDPLKILKWAAKVVGGPFATQIAAAAQMAKEMADLAIALATLANAVAGAQEKLQNCIEDSLNDAFNEIIDTLMDEASILLNQSESILDQLKADIGLTDLENAIESLTGDLNSINESINTIESAAEEAQDALGGG